MGTNNRRLASRHHAVRAGRQWIDMLRRRLPCQREVLAVGSIGIQGVIYASTPPISYFARISSQ